MTVAQNTNRLQEQLAYLIALEAAIGRKLEELVPSVSDHAGATALLSAFRTLPKEQGQALETRLQSISDTAQVSEEIAVVFPTDGLREEAENRVSTALQMVYSMFSQAVIGYSVLHPLATRFLDSSWTADEGTSYHLARQHTRNYIQAIHQVSRLLHDVVLWELDGEGSECQCLCPSCSIGICLCALAGRSFLSQAWEEAGPIADDEGVYVQHPKQNSAAAKSGLQRGDVILAAGGQEIDSWVDLQTAVRNAEPGEEIRLEVRRDSGRLEEVAVVQP